VSRQAVFFDNEVEEVFAIVSSFKGLPSSVIIAGSNMYSVRKTFNEEESADRRRKHSEIFTAFG
jgi:hypothetical protein